MRLTKYSKNAILFICSIISLNSGAQGANSGSIVSAQSGSSDYMMYLLLTFACILLIAIAVLGQVLIRLTLHAYQNKSKIVPMLILIAMLAAGCHTAWAQEAASPTAPVAAVGHAATSDLFSLDFIMALCFIILEIFVIMVMLIRIWALLNIIDPRPEAKRNFHFEFPKWFDRFNESVAIEHEKDIMLDHDYDGIKELDNQLPPWWKYGFILSICWACGYLIYFHILEAAPLSAGEYVNEMAAAKAAKDAYMLTAKNNVDENTIVFDKSYLADGQTIFTDNCVACHGDKGQGGVGPNLTDDYWLHGGKISDIFKTVKYGWPANGMKSWQSDFSSIQIAQVVCYVKSLKGSNPPDPKAPQGDLYDDADSIAKANSVNASDMTKK